jgi:hypothetical protein
MNLGFSGPITALEGVVENERRGIELAEHRHRVKELNELLASDGGIIDKLRSL